MTGRAARVGASGATIVARAQAAGPTSECRSLAQVSSVRAQHVVEGGNHAASRAPSGEVGAEGMVVCTEARAEKTLEIVDSVVAVTCVR